VRIVVETDSSPTDVLALATSVFDGLSAQNAGAIEAITTQRGPFFGERS
jgi:hypothetical protein